jgi:hypothetical protein
MTLHVSATRVMKPRAWTTLKAIGGSCGEASDDLIVEPVPFRHDTDRRFETTLVMYGERLLRVESWMF